MGYISLFDSFKYISEVGIACPIQKFVFTIKRKILISENKVHDKIWYII